MKLVYDHIKKKWMVDICYYISVCLGLCVASILTIYLLACLIIGSYYIYKYLF